MNLQPMPLRPFSAGNMRRHTRVKRWLPIAALLIIAIALVCCATSHGPPVAPRAKVVAAAPASSAVPSLEHSRRIASQADIHGASAAGRVKSAKSGLTDASTENQSLIAEVDRLRKLKTAGENDLLALYNRLVEQERKFAVMVSDLTSAENDLAAERALREESMAALVEAQAKATSKDAEANQLRSQLTQESANADSYKAAADQHSAASAANAARANQSAGTIQTLRRAILIGAILLIMSVGMNVIQLKGGSLLL